MRDLLRLVGIAILVFAVVGFAMIYSRDSAFRYGVAAFLSGSSGAITRGFSDLTGIGRDDAGPQLETTVLRMARAHQSSWVGLIGFGDETTVHFPVPAIGGFVDGRLDLLFDVQLAQGGNGLLSVAVNGERRSEIVLDSGHNSYELSLPLSASDLLADRVELVLASQGSTNSGQICATRSDNAGSVVSLQPESKIVLTSLQDVNDPQTALLAAEEPLQIYLGTDPEEQMVAIWAAQHMARAGVSTILVEDAQTPGRVIVTEDDSAPNAVVLDYGGNIVLNGTPGLRRAIEIRRTDQPDLISDWPISVASLTLDTKARNFTGSKRWSIPYRIANLPGGLTPTGFELALRASLLAEGYEWVVRVSLNDNLLHSARLPGNVPDIVLPVDLPTDLQGLENTIVVELVDTSPGQGACQEPPRAQAQLLPNGRLLASGAQPTDGWRALVRQLAAAPFVTPGNQGRIHATQATRLAAGLAQFLPVAANVTFTPESPPMTLTAVTRDELAQIIKERANDASSPQAWIVTSRGGTAAESLVLHELHNDPAAVLAHTDPTSMAILVQSPAAQ